MKDDSKLDPATLTTWQQADSPVLRAAARLYTCSLTNHRRDPIPTTTTLATRYSLPPHAIDSAKHVLESHGLIYKGPGNRWYRT